MLRLIKTICYSLIMGLAATVALAACKAATSKPKTQQPLVDRNVVYGSNVNAQGRLQMLDMDIYYPTEMAPGKRYPMVMLMHGGSFLNGKKEAMAAHCKFLADSGFVAVTINYRLGWNAASLTAGCRQVDVNCMMLATYRAVQDTHAALRFLTANAGKYHIDTKWLFVGGSSAGGFIALDMAYLTQQFVNERMPVAVEAVGRLDTASNKLTNSFKIKGVCNLWGALPDSTLINKATALPTIFYHGTADKTVPYDRGFYSPNCDRLPELYGSASLHRQTLAAEQISVLNTSPNGKHDPLEFTPKVVAANTACFFHKVMQGKAKSGSYYNAVEGCR